MTKKVSFAAAMAQEKHGPESVFHRKDTPYHFQAETSSRYRVGSADSSSANLFEDPNDPFVGHCRDKNGKAAFHIHDSTAGSDRYPRDGENSDPQLVPPPTNKIATASVEPPDVTEDSGATTDDAVGAPEGNDSALLEHWHSVTDQLLSTEDSSSPYRLRLEAFLQGQERFRAGQEKMEQLYVETKNAYDENLKKTIELIVPAHGEITECLYNLEQDLLRHFASSHEMRQAIVDTLEEANAHWQERFERLYARTVKRHGTPVVGRMELEDEEPVTTQNSSTSDISHSNSSRRHHHNQDSATATDNAHDGEKDGLFPEPDWDAILELDPSSKDAIDSFRNNSERWHAAMDELETTIDRVYSDLKEDNDTIVQTIEKAYVQILEEMEELQADIQHYIVHNAEKRTELNHALAEAEKVQLSMFQHLMQRVKGKPLSSSSSASSQPQLGTTTNGYGFPFSNPFRGSKRKANG